MLPGENKDASTVNDSAYYNLDDYEDEISDLDKNPEAIKETITDTHVRNTSVGTTSVNPSAHTSVGTTSVDPSVIGVVIIG